MPDPGNSAPSASSARPAATLPSVTVAIATIGRTDCLIAVLKQLLRQTHAPDEILVSDQNEPSLRELETFLEANPTIERIRSQLPGVVANMNLLLARARGDVVIFLDDDVVIGSDLVARHLANYADKRVGGVAGGVLQPQGDLPENEIQEIGTYHRWSGAVVGNFNASRRVLCEGAIGANMSMRRLAMIRAGGFDVGYAGNGYYFESEAMYRFSRAGNPVVFDPATRVKHLMAPRGGARIHNKAMHTFHYVRNGLRFYRQHSPTLGLVPRAFVLLIYGLLKAIKNRDPSIFAKTASAVVEGLAHPIVRDGSGLDGIALRSGSGKK